MTASDCIVLRHVYRCKGSPPGTDRIENRMAFQKGLYQALSALTLDSESKSGHRDMAGCFQNHSLSTLPYSTTNPPTRYLLTQVSRTRNSSSQVQTNSTINSLTVTTMGILSQVAPITHHVHQETGHETFYGTAIAGRDICAYEMGEQGASCP
jgi:hypothetical protein